MPGREVLPDFATHYYRASRAPFLNLSDLPEDQVMAITLKLAQSEEQRALVGKQGGSQPFFGIVTDDCIAEYRRMKSAGVKFDGEPEVQPYGTGVTLQDLYGNKIYMNQEPT